MTIGIVVALHDAVLLVADGRRGDANRVHTDDAEKIVPVREGLAVITFGVEMGTDMAVEWMRQPGGLPAKGADVGDSLAEIAWVTATSVLQRVPEKDRTLPQLKVGLVAAGFDDDEGGYVAAGLFGSLMPQREREFQRARIGEIRWMILGAESVGAREIFDTALHDHVKSLANARIESSASVPSLLAAADQTIRHASRCDQTIGGQGRFMILRRGHPTESGRL